MNPIPELAPHLKQLRLSGILDSLDARNRQATRALSNLVTADAIIICSSALI